ncbi:MAG: flagellar basal body P-ring protein FlgI [Pirellulales bacterium]|nr:flagellar basal body P-ring protein FlgI [Pirellulales bacterium]
MMTKSPGKQPMGLVLATGFLLLSCGCSSLDLFSQRFQSPDGVDVGGANAKLVGDLAVPYGMFPVTVESIGLVTCLRETGSDPAPSPHRGALLADMKARGLDRPSRLLASKGTALVLVRGVLPPGIQKDDPFDIEVRVPSQSETVSLRGGWLLDTRLKEMKILDDQQLHHGRDWGVGKGAVLVDPSADVEKNPILACRGRILGGGRALRSRSLGLVLKPEHQNVFNASRAAGAINKRFYSTSPGGIQEGMAKAINDKYVELSVHPRYKDNIPRYMQVVRSLGLRESSAKRLERMAILEKQLLDPITSAQAALQLEAIGHEGIDLLKKGLKSENTEVRFRSAEALAYLDQSEAAETLGKMARDEPAFRVFALTALATMNDYGSYEQLCALLNVASAETRYGAFRALWTMNPMDRRVMGEKLGDDFSYHVLDVSGPPMIHMTRSHRAELVLFGTDQRFLTPLLLEAGPRIRITSNGGDKVAVSRFAVGQPDQKRIVSSKVDEVIRAVAELGGTYPDIVQALQQAKAKDVLASRFEVDALPQAGRRYERTADSAEGEMDRIAEVNPETTRRSPFSLFTRPRGPVSAKGGPNAASNAEKNP